MHNLGWKSSGRAGCGDHQEFSLVPVQPELPIRHPTGCLLGHGSGGQKRGLGWRCSLEVTQYIKGSEVERKLAEDGVLAAKERKGVGKRLISCVKRCWPV